MVVTDKSKTKTNSNTPMKKSKKGKKDFSLKLPIGFDVETEIDDVNLILPKTKTSGALFLGNYKIAKNSDFFKKNKIKAVLNCTRDLDNTFQCKTGFDVEYIRIPLEDDHKKKSIELMTKYFELAVNFIYTHHVLRKENVLVHCVAGRSRSFACVVAYIMKFLKLNYADAIKFVLTKRIESAWYGTSVNFLDSLEEYSKILRSPTRTK